jgi:tripartite-type tricarboxylate transporter receptor subunit TctC
MAAGLSLAQDYPVKPIRITVPVPPGGANDTLTRLVAPRLAEALRQPVVIDNRPGGSTTIGTAHVAKSAPDGYVLLMAPSAHTVNDTLFGSLPYDPIRDFTPVATIAGAPLLLCVHPSLPVRNVKDLVSLAKARPGELNYASAGNGTSSHLAAELFKSVTGTKIVHVPYKGGVAAAADVVGGHVLMMFGTVQSSVTYVNAKRLHALGVTSARRSTLARHIPTLAEAGLPGVEVGSWFGIVGPAGLPREVVAKLDAEVRRITESAEMRERLMGLGYEIMYMSSNEFAAYLKADRARWSKVIREAGIRLES